MITISYIYLFHMEVGYYKVGLISTERSILNIIHMNGRYIKTMRLAIQHA